MLFLPAHYITDLYVLVDEILPETKKIKGGRPLILSNSEIVTILILNVLTTKQKTLKDVYDWVRNYHKRDFPNLPKYKGFVAHCHRVIPLLVFALENLLASDKPLRFLDSTMLPVCKITRADFHKVAKDVAKFGKNHQGWHYGFKLHASIDQSGRLCQISFTPANQHDAQELPRILNKHAKVAVGDGAYNASVMRRIIFEHLGTIIIAPPHPKQDKKIAACWQHKLLRARAKIEAVFDILKEHLHLVSSFPRSVSGYLLHYLRILIGYQIMVWGF